MKLATRILFAALTALMFAVPAADAADAQVDPDAYRTSSRTPFYGRSDGVFYGRDSKIPFLITNAEDSIIPGSPTYTITFDEGASKGLQLMQSDGTAYDSTALALNILEYSGGARLVSMNIVDVGATIPAALATGLDMVAGTNNDDDQAELYAGIYGTNGRPLVVGTDPASSFCATLTITDVSDSDATWCGFRDATPVASVVGSYTAYAAIGHVSGDINVGDITTGATDTTDNWADAGSHEICTLVSSAGVVTYTLDGAAPTVTDAHTFTDGAVLIPFCSVLNAVATPDPTVVSKWEVRFP